MSGGGEKGLGTTKTPADFLKSIRGRPVVVKLNSGVDYRGTPVKLLYILLLVFLDSNVLFLTYWQATCQMMLCFRCRSRPKLLNS